MKASRDAVEKSFKSLINCICCNVYHEWELLLNFQKTKVIYFDQLGNHLLSMYKS